MELDDFLEGYADDPDEWSDLTPQEARTLFEAAIKRLAVVTAERDAFEKRAITAEERAEDLRGQAGRPANRVRNNVVLVATLVLVGVLWTWVLYQTFIA